MKKEFLVLDNENEIKGKIIDNYVCFDSKIFEKYGENGLDIFLEIMKHKINYDDNYDKLYYFCGPYEIYIYKCILGKLRDSDFENEALFDCLDLDIRKKIKDYIRNLNFSSLVLLFNAMKKLYIQKVININGEERLHSNFFSNNISDFETLEDLFCYESQARFNNYIQNGFANYNSSPLEESHKDLNDSRVTSNKQSDENISDEGNERIGYSRFFDISDESYLTILEKLDLNLKVGSKFKSIISKFSFRDLKLYQICYDPNLDVEDKYNMIAKLFPFINNVFVGRNEKNRLLEKYGEKLKELEKRFKYSDIVNFIKQVEEEYLTVSVSESNDYVKEMIYMSKNMYESLVNKVIRKYYKNSTANLAIFSEYSFPLLLYFCICLDPSLNDESKFNEIIMLFPELSGLDINSMYNTYEDLISSFMKEPCAYNEIKKFIELLKYEYYIKEAKDLLPKANSVLKLNISEEDYMILINDLRKNALFKNNICLDCNYNEVIEAKKIIYMYSKNYNVFEILYGSLDNIKRIYSNNRIIQTINSDNVSKVLNKIETFLLFIENRYKEYNSNRLKNIRRI